MFTVQDLVFRHIIQQDHKRKYSALGDSPILHTVCVLSKRSIYQCIIFLTPQGKLLKPNDDYFGRRMDYL